MERKSVIVSKLFLFALLGCITLGISSCGGGKKEVQKTWSDMDFNERKAFLVKELADNNIENARELESKVKGEIVQRYASSARAHFELAPDLTSSDAQVAVYPDQTFVVVPFVCIIEGANNQRLSGTVVYEYNPDSKQLSIQKWGVDGESSGIIEE